MLPLLKFSTFNVSIRRPAFCENRSIERMFATHVTCPRSIKLNVPLEIQGKTRFYTRQYKINSHQVKDELCRLVNEGKPLYQGKTLYGGLLVIAEYRSNFIELAANPDYKPYPENRCESSAKNVLRKISSLTNGAPDESIKDLVEGDLKACIRILAQDHPEEVKDAINNRNFDPILARQDGKALANILHIVISGLLKLEQIYSSSDIKDLYHFLPQDTLKEITDILSANNIFITGQYCRRVHKAISRLKSSDQEKVQRIVKQANENILYAIYKATKQINKTLGVSLPNFYEKPEQEIEPERLREAIRLLWEANIPSILPPGYIDEIAHSISESAREKLLAQIDKSNLVENAKQPLLHMLAEKEYIYVSMYSFTSPLYTAALMAAMLRGTQVRILMDKQQAAQASSQYDEMLNLAHEMRHIYPNLPPFEPRLSQDVQHQKNIIFGSGTYILGSQNMTWNGMAHNLEDFIIVKNDPVSHQAKEREFLDLYGFSGSFISFPKEIASQPWLQRSGLTGIRFKDRIPNPGEVDEIMRQFRMSIADFSKIRNIMEIAKGKNFEIEYDFTRPFHPFMVGMDPVIARFLTRFLEDVPLGFAFAPASESGKFHPGTTTGLSGLIEHELIGCELVTVLCKVLGREDLRDRALAAFIAHDTYKDAHKQEDGTITWGHYNPAHGPLAEEKFNQAIENAEPAERDILKTVLQDAGIAIGKHMGAYNEPVPTPLLPTDPEIKRIVQLADVLASRKYLLVKHRAMQPHTTEEILNLMLNNSFTIEGEGLSSIGRDPEIFNGIKKIAASIGYKINSYEDLPQHAQEMLRVAESLCDVYSVYKEVITKKEEVPTEEEKSRIENRNEVLGAVLLYAMLRYRHGIDAPKSDVQFSETIAKFAKAYTVPAYPDPDNRLARLIGLVRQADEILTTPFRAKLRIDEDPALQIICLANCIMTEPKIDILTTAKVIRGLSGVKEPKTVWTRRKFKAETEKKLMPEIRDLIFKEYRAEFTALVSEGLLSRLNQRRKTENQLPAIHSDIISALIDKYGSILPSYIYKNFYSLNDQDHTELVKRIKAANTDEKARKDLIIEIGKLPEPTEKSPDRIFDMVAKTILANGISSIDKLKEAVLQSRDTKAMVDYKDFKPINTAIEHLLPKLADPKEKILIYGDYDVDGQTSTAILVKTLRWIKAKELSKTMDSEAAQKIAEETIGYYIPHRLHEGYGVNADALERIHRRGYTTVITVDCGIRDRELVKRAKKMGIDFIITDHHEPEPKDLPLDAVAILNPKHNLKDLTPEELKALNIKDIKDHPAYYLPGAGVAYKLARALAEKAGIDIKDSFIDSVGFAVIADIVNMTGENRAFARAALQRLTTLKRNKGIGAVLKALHIENIDEESLAFMVAPLFNAAGRFGKAYLGLKLLMARTEKEASQIAQEIFPLLAERREIERTIMRDVEKKLNFDPEKDDGIIVAGSWHAGIIGLAASKLVTKYGVPAVTINIPPYSRFSSEQNAYGSMRSIKGVSAIAILAACNKRYRQETGEKLFVGFGGHEGAAGFKIKKEKIADLERIYQEVAKQIVKGRRSKMVVAGKLKAEDIKGLSKEEIKIFKRFLAPFGPGFEQPKFEFKAKVLRWQAMGRDRQHIKGMLEGGIPFVYYFGNQAWVKRILMQKEARLVVKIGIESYQGKENVQFTVEDIKAAK